MLASQSKGHFDKRDLLEWWGQKTEWSEHKKEECIGDALPKSVTLKGAKSVWLEGIWVKRRTLFLYHCFLDGRNNIMLVY